MNTKLCRAVNKIKEPSTWSGIGLLAALVGISQPIYAAVSTAVMAIAGVAAVVLDEKVK